MYTYMYTYNYNDLLGTRTFWIEKPLECYLPRFMIVCIQYIINFHGGNVLEGSIVINNGYIINFFLSRDIIMWLYNFNLLKTRKLKL